jgi:flagellar FliL protein
MAEEKEKKDEEGKAEEAPKKGKKKLFIIIGIVVLVAVIGAAAFFTLGGKSHEEDEEGEETEEEAHGEEEGTLPPAVMPLEPFIVNLTVRGAFLKTTIQLEFTEPELPHDAENNVAKIRDAIIRVLSGKTANEILATDGKENLRSQLKQAVNTALGSEEVTQVYFTDFIIQ